MYGPAIFGKRDEHANFIVVENKILNDALLEGWIPTGGVASERGQLYQAFIKKEGQLELDL